jgi:bifunctional non-homologous end joining protein LigD
MMLEIAAEFQLEGVVAKASRSPYQPGRRSLHWRKTPLRYSARLVVGGWIPSRSQPDAVGSLLVGGYRSDGNLIYCGHVAFGFSNRSRRALYTWLTEIPSVDPPFTGLDPSVHGGYVRWVKPLLVGRVEYREKRAELRLMQHSSMAAND